MYCIPGVKPGIEEHWRIAHETSWKTSIFHRCSIDCSPYLFVFFGVTSYYGDVEKTIIKGADDIRWGIDIRGGVDVTFCAPADIDPTEEQMAAAESIIKLRLVNQNITDYEVYTDLNKNRVIVRFRGRKMKLILTRKRRLPSWGRLRC